MTREKQMIRLGLIASSLLSLSNQLHAEQVIVFVFLRFELLYLAGGSHMVSSQRFVLKPLSKRKPQYLGREECHQAQEHG